MKSVRGTIQRGGCLRDVIIRLVSVERKMKQALPATDDWVELEERRRTFWAAYIADKWASTANN